MSIKLLKNILTHYHYQECIHRHFYKIGSQHSHVLQEARFVSFCAGETDDVKACEFLLSQHRGLKLTETLCSSYEQPTQQK